MKSKVSVIIPVYNVEKYIENTLYSVTQQDYQNIEIIVIDDGSTDKTIEKCIKFKEKTLCELKLIKSSNNGVSNARNIGLNNSSGEYIFFLDGDDEISKDTISKMVNKIESSESDLVFCGVNKVKDNKIIENYNKNYKYFKEVKSGKDTIKLLLKGKILFSAISILYKKTIITNNKLQFTVGCVNGEDQEFYIKYLIFCKYVISVNEELAFYIQREKSISNTFNKNKLSALGAFYRLKKYENIDGDSNLKKLLDNKIRKEFFTNFNSALKFYDNSNEIFIKSIIKNKNYLRHIGIYRPCKFSKDEFVLFGRYIVFYCTPRFYVKIIKRVYNRYI